MRSTIVATMVAFSCGCSIQPAAVGQLDRGIVGGQAESGYAPVGYLMTGTPLSGPNCGVTVIDAHAAVTAAHCIYYSGGSSAPFGIGLGTVGSGPAYAASRVFVHPQYNANSTDASNPRYHHDVAVLLFDSPLPVAPAQRGATAAGAQVRYIGYGRTTPGDVNVSTGYTNERKSTGESVTATDATNIFVTGVGGGLCWGDSGGPLMQDGGNTIYGVLADFDQVFDCHVGNQMIFTSLAAESAFVDQALSCIGSSDPGCQPTVQKPQCQYACVDYGFAPGQCYQGWTCLTDGCLQYVGSCDPVQTCTPACSGKQCGDDGCGGQCGSCAAGQTCSDAGQCQTIPVAGGSCSGLTPWDAGKAWYDYSVGEEHIGSNGHRYACKSTGYCFYDPTSADGVYGWTDEGAC